MERDSFVVYKSFYESINIEDLPDETQLELYRAIFEYGFYGKEPKLKGISNSIFTLIKPQIDANNKRYCDGKKGGRPKKGDNLETKKTSGYENKKPVVINKKTSGYENKKPNDNVNVNVNVNVNDKEKNIILKKEKHKFGKFGRIKLTEEEYTRLINEYGKEFIDNQITLLDEYVESNNNKNKYTNFNLVLRKSIMSEIITLKTMFTIRLESLPSVNAITY